MPAFSSLRTERNTLERCWRFPSWCSAKCCCSCSMLPSLTSKGHNRRLSPVKPCMEAWNTAYVIMRKKPRKVEKPMSHTVAPTKSCLYFFYQSLPCINIQLQKYLIRKKGAAHRHTHTRTSFPRLFLSKAYEKRRPPRDCTLGLPNNLWRVKSKREQRGPLF